MSDIEFIDLPPIEVGKVESSRKRRTKGQEAEFFLALSKSPGRWAVWSRHANLTSARSRRSQLQNRERFSSYDVEWYATEVELDGEQVAVVTVRWVGQTRNSYLDTSQLGGDDVAELVAAVKSKELYLIPRTAHVVA